MKTDFGKFRKRLFFNFPGEGGHLWLVPMLLGLYLLMPLWIAGVAIIGIPFLCYTDKFPFYGKS